ncbi:MerR family transcriptional regulator [Stenoxybacter acetivorans]|uniref:MerR family transcriptional regulator n=1 Tax=Stenoxybacter acetivorans TaxID=422441 RepID=UPI000559DB51|nr:MerR family transcriptional regulator [Stenoxybacter acetivorans]
MTIAEVCRRFGMTADTLRYYEKTGLIPKPTRTNGGIRNYSEYDCGWIAFIKCMRSAGVQVESLVAYVRLFEQGDGTLNERKQILIHERNRISAKITEMQETLDRLNGKIENYEQHIIPAEDLLKDTD